MNTNVADVEAELLGGCYDEGEQACIAGTSVFLNPYRDSTLAHDNWHHGWVNQGERRLFDLRKAIEDLRHNSVPHLLPGTQDSLGCIGCGETRLVAYTIERKPGPFCYECWSALKMHVAQVNLLNANVDRRELCIETTNAMADRLLKWLTHHTDVESWGSRLLEEVHEAFISILERG